MKLVVFSSGSSGNCTLIKTNKLNILVDVGITKKQIEANLEKQGLSLCDINYVFITHEHTDHVKALPQMLKISNIQIVISQGTLDAYLEYNMDNKKLCSLIDSRIEEGSMHVLIQYDNSILYPSLSFDGLDIDILPLFHDAKEPIGFVFKEDGKKLCYITDTGYVHRDLYPLIVNCDCYILESNHDPELLMASNRPYYTKLRIVGDHGHLSNEDSMCLLANLMGDKTKLVMHAHVSQECNLSIVIEGTRKQVFDSYGIDVSNIEFVILSVVATKEYEI